MIESNIKARQRLAELETREPGETETIIREEDRLSPSGCGVEKIKCRSTIRGNLTERAHIRQFLNQLRDVLHGRIAANHPLS